MKRLLKIFLLCVFLTVVIIFSFINRHDIALFLPNDSMVEMPMHLFVLIIFSVALTIGIFSSSWHYYSKLRVAQKKLKHALRESDALRQELLAIQTETRGRDYIQPSINNAMHS